MKSAWHFEIHWQNDHDGCWSEFQRSIMLELYISLDTLLLFRSRLYSNVFGQMQLLSFSIIIVYWFWSATPDRIQSWQNLVDFSIDSDSGISGRLRSTPTPASIPTPQPYLRLLPDYTRTEVACALMNKIKILLPYGQLWYQTCLCSDHALWCHLGRQRFYRCG